MRKDLKRRGFKFVGSTICYAFMQATGLVNDHLARVFPLAGGTARGNLMAETRPPVAIRHDRPAPGGHGGPGVPVSMSFEGPGGARTPTAGLEAAAVRTHRHTPSPTLELSLQRPRSSVDRATAS